MFVLPSVTSGHDSVRGPQPDSRMRNQEQPADAERPCRSGALAVNVSILRRGANGRSARRSAPDGPIGCAARHPAAAPPAGERTACPAFIRLAARLSAVIPQRPVPGRNVQPPPRPVARSVGLQSGGAIGLYTAPAGAPNATGVPYPNGAATSFPSGRGAPDAVNLIRPCQGGHSMELA